MWITSLRRGKCEDEFGADSLGADDIDVLVVCADDFPDDGQAKADALFVSAAGDIGLVKALPDFWQILFGNALTEVFDGDEDELFPLVGADQNLLSGWTEFDRVVDEVVEHLLNAAHVGADAQGFFRKIAADRQIFFLTEHLEGIDRAADHRRNVEFGKIQIDALVIEAVQQQQSLRKLVQPFSLAQDDAEIALLHFRRDRAVEHGLHVAFDRGQRGAEVVRNI